MVKKFFGLLGREISGLHEAAYLLAFFTFLSQLLGLVRDRLLASTFGASAALDAYYAAFRLPDLILMVIVSALVFLLSPKLLTLIFPKIIAGQYGAELITMTRWLLLSPILLGLSNLLASITQAKHRFFFFSVC